MAESKAVAAPAVPAATVPKLELKYFFFRGHAEALRLLLAFTQTPFVDTRVDFTDWPSLKAHTPQAKLPVLVEDGRTICQAMAIARHIARVKNIYGNTEDEMTRADELAETVCEFRERFAAIAYAGGFPFGREKSELRMFLNEKAPHMLKALEQLHRGKRDFFVTDTATYADVIAFAFLDEIFSLRPSLAEAHPKLGAFAKAIRALDGVHAYLPKRPPFDFEEFLKADQE